ncbi:class I SAM-dependent methyltransferase [Glycomyces harbinensis]|uniref:Methyltransferase domain-containing protein n=1 Tax=Glycomyces harbinensis TaxID=58114 RepID=A0A1G6RNV5_9ACTN|nr:class I SAM-dependent methyltransferase [Glycomyces harbinensis]SDD05627.1 Methyltransferase domain-containing protein [Glycomyces harbinensis]
MGRRSHRLFARWYPQAAASLEDRGLGEQRARLLAGVGGRVLEVGAGHGANFPHYPQAVTELIAVEPEERLRDLAQEKAGDLGLKATVLDGEAEHLAFENDSFDAVVTTLVLCSVADQDRALAEIHRVLKPGGELVCLEHVASANRAILVGEKVFDAVLWSHVFGGCHTARDTGAAIERAGFDTEGLEPHRLPYLPFPLKVSPHLVGSARKPA